jgi:20S proteasome alpha/beta subunit
MTVIVAVKFPKGVVVATDSRITYGESEYVRDMERKLDSLNDEVAFTHCGLNAATDRITRELKTYVETSGALTFDEVVKKCEDIMWDFYNRYGARLEDEVEKGGWSVELFSSDRIVIIEHDGVAAEEGRYLCEGSGIPYAEYILQQRYRPNLSEQECKELAAYTVIQTSRIDPSVGGPVNLAVIKKNGFKHLSRDEIDEIVENITETPVEYELKVQNLVEEIVERRRWINDIFLHKFKKILFIQEEYAISQIQKTCKSEDDFTNRIAALALLIDRMEGHDFGETAGPKTQGSVNLLEAFARKRIPELKPECITNLREIYWLRSKKMPIHEDDPKIVQTLLKWEYKIPPNWSSLWIKALTKYRDSLDMLKKAIQ